MTERYDVIIIGTGAGGDPLAPALTVDPALTAMPNAIRVGRHMIDPMG